MQSFPSKYQGGFTNNSGSCYFIDMHVLNLGVTQHLYLSNITASFTYSGSVRKAQTEYLAATIINSNGGEQTVDGIGELDLSLDNIRGGTQSAINITSLTLLQQGNFVSSHSYDFENQPIAIWKGYANRDAGVVVESDMVKVFDGVIVQAYNYDNTQFRIDCVDRRALDKKNVLNYFISRATTPHADSNALNKFIPTLLGDFLTPNTVPLTASLMPYVLGQVFAAPTLIADIYKGQSLVSDSEFTLTGSVFITTDSSKYISVVSASQYTISTASVGNLVGEGVIDSINVTPHYGEMYIIPSAQGYHIDVPSYPPGRTVDPGNNGGNYIVDFGDAVDSDTTSSVIVNKKWTGGFEGYWVHDFLQVELPSFDEPGTMVNRSDIAYRYSDAIDFYIGGVFEYHGGVTGGGTYGEGEADFVMSFMRSNDVGQYKAYPFPDKPNDVPFIYEFPVNGAVTVLEGNWTSDVAMTWDVVKGLYFLMGPNLYVTPGDDGTKQLKVHNLWIRARTRYENTGITKVEVNVPKYKNTDARLEWNWFDFKWVPPQQVLTGYTTEIRGSGISNLFVPAQGPTFTSAMTRSNGHTTSDVIEDPASCIEWLLRYKLDIPTQNLDTASFDALNNTTNGRRKDWRVAVSMLDRNPVLEYINDICYEYHMSLVMTQDGRYRLVAHDSGSTVYTINSSSIYFDGYPQISVSQTPNESIYNEMTVNYGFDYIRSATQKSLYISDTNFDGTLENNLTNVSGALRNTSYVTWCDDSITRYNTHNQFVLDSRFIHDDTTAELSLKKFAEWLAFKRLIVTMKCVPNLNIQALEVGDLVLIDDDLLTPLFKKTAQFMVVGKTIPSVSPTPEPYITITAMEMPNPNTGTPILTRAFISSEDLGV